MTDPSAVEAPPLAGVQGEVDGAATVPHTFHWIWLGSDPLPRTYRAWMTDWERMHPGWEVRLWCDADLPPLRNRKAFDQARSAAQRADVLRYEILLDHGGVYLDTDMECLRSFEPLTDASSAFVGEEREGLLGNAVLGACAGHPWLQQLVEALPGSVEAHWQTMDETGPGFLSRETAHRDDVTIYPPSYFYASPSTAKGTRTAPPNAYALHHFAKSWQPAEVRMLGPAASAALELLPLASATVVLVSEGVPVRLPPGCRAVPFVERSGEDWGAPADDDQALLELDRQRSRGVEWFIFVVPAFWWLDHYVGLASALRSAADEVLETSAAVAFHLPRKC